VVKNVIIITGKGMVSVFNECQKIKQTITKKGYNCDLVLYQTTSPHRTPSPRYSLAIWFTPLLPMYMPIQRLWLRRSICDKCVSYYVIEGIVHGIRPYLSWLKWQYIITPSKFVKRNLEEMGISVKEVIPHQLPDPMPINLTYGYNWRRKLPKNKRILLYVGTQIVRKGLPKLNEAIKILSKRRNDFVMVYHTDNVKNPYHTPIEKLDAPNTVVETDFGRIGLPEVYAKMYFSDFIVHPALTEGFGLPVLEALALGKPLVCVNAYGVNEIANPKNSFMVTEVKPSTLKFWNTVTFKIMDYSPEALADKIDEALSSTKEELEAKITAGLETTQKFKNTYQKFTKFLEK